MIQDIAAEHGKWYINLRWLNVADCVVDNVIWYV